ncbi:hypothetical protein PPACK8108_LOCUS24697 [Phakopsora pachyrhizi]|uniref:PH domain-containing protein n=1 Tax=Phakopsora pachyrhizi TaxID=170000 RepID=A0AAV0BVF3_PHAPC|nr:hypothetical protein PPACK8108_LOCUS24697 [Phakopsora pachyrhizi]
MGHEAILLYLRLVIQSHLSKQSGQTLSGDQQIKQEVNLQDENHQLWAVISRSKSELNQVKSENRDLRQRVTNLESRLAILQSSDRDPGSLGGLTTRTIAPTPTGLPRSPAPSNSRSDHHQLVQQPLSPSEKKFQPINSNNLSTSELGDHRPSPSSAKNCLPANPSSQSNPSRRATEPTESSNQPLRPDQTTHRIRKQYSADPTNIQVPGSYSAASKADSSLSISPVNDISDHLKPSSHQILRTLSCSASSEIPLNFPSSQSTQWDSSRSNTNWSPASPNPLIPPNTLNLRSDTSPQPIHSASAKLSPKLRQKASSVDMTRSAKESKDENPLKSPPKALLNNKFWLSLHPSSTSASPSNSSPNSRASYWHSIVPPEVRQLMLNHSLSPTTPLPTSHPSIRTDKIPSALGSNATATTASSDVSSTPHPLTPSTSHGHQAGDETGRLKSPNAVDSQASYAINQSIISAQRSPRTGISPTEATTTKLAVNAQNSSNSSALLPSHTVDRLYTTQPSTRRQMLTPTFLPLLRSRYYVLNGPVLEYFDSRGGTKLGFLGITGAQIGRQQQQRMHKEKEGKVDHILCAETDEERDAWVEALTCYISGCFVSAEGTMSTSESSNQTPTGITSSPASNGRSRRQTSLDGFNRSETSLFNPQHQSSTSQDMCGETKTKIRDSGMPKSNSSNQATVSTKSDLQAPMSKAAIAKEQALPMRRSTSKEHPLKQELLNVAPETRDQFSRAKSSFANHRDNLNRQKLLEYRGNQLGNPANNGPTTPCTMQARLLQQAQLSPQQDQTTSDAKSALNSSIDCPHTPDPQRPNILGPMNGAPITGGYRLKPVEEKRAKFRSAFWGFGGRNAGSGKLIFWA